MQPITGRRSPSLPLRPEPCTEAENAEPAQSRSLVVVSVASQRADRLKPAGRPAAPFLAHLIASAQQLPQTRARRRAEPGEAAVRYAAAAPMRTGDVLRATM